MEIFIKSGMAVLITSKTDARAKKMTRDKEILYIIMKESTHLEDTAILIVFTLNNRAANHPKCKVSETNTGGSGQRQ